MIRNFLDVTKHVVTYLNPGETPVVELDQPLYALAKKIQWHHPDTYAQMMTMMGPLQTEIAFMNTVGNLLKDSGWTSIITNAQVARSEVAQSPVSWHDVI